MTTESKSNVTEVNLDEQKPRTRTVATHLIATIAGGALVGTLAFTGVLPVKNTQNNTPAATQQTTQQITRTLTGTDAKTMKIDATNKLTEIFQAIANTPNVNKNVKDADQLAKEVAEGNYDNVPAILKDTITGGDEATRQANMVAVIYLADGLSKSMGGADNIKPISEQAIINNCDAQPENGVVHIPQNVYTATKVPVDVLMIYQDNQWKLDGFSLTIEEIIVGTLQSQSAPTTSTPSAN